MPRPHDDFPFARFGEARHVGAIICLTGTEVTDDAAALHWQVDALRVLV